MKVASLEPVSPRRHELRFLAGHQQDRIAHYANVGVVEAGETSAVPNLPIGGRPRLGGAVKDREIAVEEGLTDGLRTRLGHGAP